MAIQEDSAVPSEATSRELVQAQPGGPVPVRAQPEAEAKVLGCLPPGLVAEVLRPRKDAWARLPRGELARFGVPGDRDAWLHVDEACLRVVGCRAAAGDVLFQADALPSGAGPTVEVSREDPLAADYPEDGPGPLDALAATVTDEVLRRLWSDGFAIVDDVLPPEVRSCLREEMEALLENEQYWESQSYGSNEGALHHSIVETTLDFREVPRFAPTFAKMEQDQGLMRRLRHLPTLTQLRKQHLRLQVNKGNGGCYTMHTDSGVTESDSGAQVLKTTALFYLNEGWQQGDGGELRLFPFPRPPVTIPPLDGRLVLFEPRMVHEVLPNFRKRFCFTLWCASADEEASRNSYLDMDLECVTGFERAVAVSEDARRAYSLPRPVSEEVPCPLRALFLPEVRPIIVRYVWRHCELQSAKQSHNDGPQKREMLEGIAYYHKEMETFNPQWLRQLLESLPRSFEEEEAAGDGQLLGARQIADLVLRHCPWWE